ncbi:Cysteine-rich PDZ-binding [Musa troglodytarum]|uniref:Cysteine-rich PDZ-binding protein n=1 Tax=Musa troglodytarum TaxID=320322 RepID=A0A9E7HVF6_9LILI|nr:Cysteine-rich PDZ-binding [Musa troglodytarum]
MVCDKCEKKLAKVIVPDKWKEGASNTTESGGRKINENKLLSKKNRNVTTSSQFLDACDILHSGPRVCAMCGKQVLDTKFYKQSNV